MSNSNGFEVITDQDGDPLSIACKLQSFAIAKQLRGEGVRAGTVKNTTEDDRYDALEDQIASINRQLPDGWQIGWHPDESGTVVYARSGWFDEHDGEDKENDVCPSCGDIFPISEMIQEGNERSCKSCKAR